MRRLSFILVCIATLTACAPSTSATTRPPDATPGPIAAKLTPSQQQQFNDICRSFNESAIAPTGVSPQAMAAACPVVSA